MDLKKYIRQNYDSQREFARINNCREHQVSEWISKGFIVVDGVLYSKRRELIKKVER